MGNLRISGRADLLRALADAYGRDPDAVSGDELARFALLLDWHPQPPASGEDTQKINRAGNSDQGPDDDSGAPDGDDIVSDPPPTPEPKRRPPLQARFFAVLESREMPAKEEERPPSKAIQPLTAAECGPLDLREPPPITPLVPRTRLWPALRRSLSHARADGVDMPALVRRLSRAESIRRLPRATRRSAAGEVWIVFDIAQRLIPYERDLVGIIDEVRRLQGVANVRLWLVSEVPDAVLSVQRGRGEMEEVVGRIPAPPTGTPVLILGDLGLLSHDRRGAPQWIAFCRRIAAAGARPVAWVPASPQLITREAVRHASVHCLGAGDLRPLKPGRCADKPQWPDAALRCLLTRMACCARVEPALLRSFRLMSPDTAAEPGLEALVWSHPTDVQAGYRFCEISTAAQTHYRMAFAVLSETESGCAEQDEILRRTLDWHAYRGRSTESVELLVWRAHAGREAPEGSPAERMAAATSWIERLVGNLDSVSDDVAGYARDLIARQGGDKFFVNRNSRTVGALWRLLETDKVPSGLNVEDVFGESSSSAVPYELVQYGDRLKIEPAERVGVGDDDTWLTRRAMNFETMEWYNPARGVVPDSRLEIAGQFDWGTLDGGFRLRLDAPQSKDGQALPMAEEAAVPIYRLASASRQLLIAPLVRPSWAIEWGFDILGLYVQAPSPLGGEVRLHSTPWSPEPWRGHWPLSHKAFQAVATPIGHGMTIGSDLQYGLYLDVPFGSTTQRFRWIEPGEFWMGSPESEVEREANEGPRHLVRLTEGFWLADTACSQGVWQTVMGNNPSHFTDDPENPVEMVSWDDVQDFLRQVEKRLPGVKADLPTEAEWEYACRAGSETTFNWGNGIAPSQANYQATESYADGLTGEWRGKTVPVRSYAPNGWGLYQMHGNVWEWCADGRRIYDGLPQIDPRGPAGDEGGCVVRGGSWFNVSRGLYAAFRNQGLRSERFDCQGFRFSLRPTSREEAQEPGGLRSTEGGLSGRDPRLSYLDYALTVIEASDKNIGSVPWAKLRETIPIAKRPRPKFKRGDKK